MQPSSIYDLAILGGGINGMGIAVEAAGHGLSVFLCEKDDFASHTSSASTKLIHGGLRYLEQYEFRLVRESLSEREILMKKAPHLIQPINFVMPHNPESRPAWMIKLGLFLYDHLGYHQRLGRSHVLPLTQNLSNPLNARFSKAFSYWDCMTDDSRLVISNALRAHELGAHLSPRTQAIYAERKEGFWEIGCMRQNGTLMTIHAKALVNATGPFVQKVLEDICHEASPYQMQLVQGSHILIPKSFIGKSAYLLQHPDHRVVFAIPYLDRFTMIGTTDRLYKGSLEHIKASDEEITYLCDIYNQYFHTSISPQEVVHHWSGVRPLFHDGHQNPSKTTRDYRLHLSTVNQALPLLSIFGGKLTTYRQLAKQAFEQLQPFFSIPKSYDSQKDYLPGGDIPDGDFEGWLSMLLRQYPWLDKSVLNRLAKAYGTRLHQILGDAQSVNDLGKHYGEGLYEREVVYLRTHEWASSDEDILFRRSKMGYLLNRKFL